MTSDDRELLAERFEQNRPYLRSVAYRMLGSIHEADDAVQEAWLRVARNGDDSIDDLRAWLTTVVGRICLDMLRARRARREVASDDVLPELIVSEAVDGRPEEQAEIVDSVSIALLVVLETLSPAERLAFVLHDVFGVSFDEIAQIANRSPMAARQLASRARRRVQGQSPTPPRDLREQRRVVDAFLAASRAGDFEGLIAVLDPDVVFRLDRSASGTREPVTVIGAQAAAQRILARGSRLAHLARPAIVNGSAGVVVRTQDQVISVVAFTVRGGRITGLDLYTDPETLRAAIP